MANLINLYAESGANIIGDDSQPTLTISNTGGGVALAVQGIAITSAASIDILNIGTANVSIANVRTITSTASNEHILSLTRTVVGTYSVAALVLPVASVASGPAIQLAGSAFVSAVSLIFAAGAGWAGMGAIRVRRTDNSFGWIPVLPDAQVTAGVF